MDVSELLDKTRGDIDARHVFGAPVQQGDAVIIPAAKVRGGGGGGEGQGPSEQGSGAGSGFGISARPVGVFVIREGQVRWRPAVDVNRVILGGQIVGAIGLIVLGTILRARNRAVAFRRAGRGIRRLIPFLRSIR